MRKQQGPVLLLLLAFHPRVGEEPMHAGATHAPIPPSCFASASIGDAHPWCEAWMHKKVSNRRIAPPPSFGAAKGHPQCARQVGAEQEPTYPCLSPLRRIPMERKGPHPSPFLYIKIREKQPP